MIVADLHTHSTASDGECSPAEVVGEARSLGFRAMALTDHDTLSGLEEALQAAEKQGIIVIPGIEVSLCFRRPQFTGSLHYLCYFQPRLLADPDFCSSVKTCMAEGRGRKLVRERIAALNAMYGPHGSHEVLLTQPLAEEEMPSPGSSVTRRHFVKALIERHGLTLDTANRLMSNKSPAYVPSGIEMGLLKPLFDRYPFVKVLAHPAAGSYPKPNIYSNVLPPIETVERLLPEFLLLGLDGIEVFYPGHTPEHIDLLAQWSRTHHLLMTGGSDFHDRIARPMGIAGIDEELLNKVLSRVLL
jgi:3',5'-nucleoside bisphosphate phosphatase